MSENYNDLTGKVLSALQSNPDMITDLVKKNAENATRALLPGEDDAQTSMLKGILGSDVSTDALAAVTQALGDNGIMQLMMGSDGSINPAELLSYTGGFTASDKANPNNDNTVRALLDGKLDFKEILMLIALLKLFKGKSSASASTASGVDLLSSLMGGSSSSSNSMLNLLLGSMAGTSSGSSSLLGSLLGASQPAPVQQQSSGGLLSSLLGGSSQQSSGGGLLSSLFGGSTQTQAQTAAAGAIPFGTAASSNTAAASALESFLGGNTGNNAQAQQLYSLLNNSSQTAFNDNGQVNVSSLFSLANQLFG